MVLLDHRLLCLLSVGCSLSLVSAFFGDWKLSAMGKIPKEARGKTLRKTLLAKILGTILPYCTVNRSRLSTTENSSNYCSKHVTTHTSVMHFVFCKLEQLASRLQVD